MATEVPDLASPNILRFTDGRSRRPGWKSWVPLGVFIVALAVLLDGRAGRTDDIQIRACLEPVYAGLFGTGSHAMARCIQNRPRLFGARDAQWLRYVRHLEASCPLTIGMQGQAICEFNVKAKEDRAGKGWRDRSY